MKTTPLTAYHEALNAKMADFAGYNMPISYTGIKEEHHAVRQRAGIFDVSHMGEFIVRGKQALDFVQYVISNDASKLTIGQAQYACLPNATGGIVDDLLVYRLPEDYCAAGEQAFMLVVNAANIEKDWNWLEQHRTSFDCRMIDISEQTGLIAVQGPLATRILQPLTDLPLTTMGYYTFQKGRFGGFDNVLVSATGYTGAGGVEIYAENNAIHALWPMILEAGKEEGLLPAGLGARDTLRLEMGYCLYGNDIDDTTSPLEAGLGWITKLNKGEFVGREAIAAGKAAGLKRKLVGLTIDDRRVARHDYPIMNDTDELIGKVTSGTLSPTLDAPIAMGYLPAEYATVGTVVHVDMGRKKVPATVAKTPFI